MKYNMDIYCVGFTGCKACVFLLVLMQSLKTSTGCFPRGFILSTKVAQSSFNYTWSPIT